MSEVNCQLSQEHCTVAPSPPKNARAFLSRDEIDGALVGGASLRAGEFGRIVAVANSST